MDDKQFEQLIKEVKSVKAEVSEVGCFVFFILAICVGVVIVKGCV